MNYKMNKNINIRNSKKIILYLKKYNHLVSIIIIIKEIIKKTFVKILLTSKIL
jgi:hypothetical protein